MHLARRLTAPALGIPFVIEAVTILRMNHVALLRRLPDDGFYYLEIARRLGRAEGSTFDGWNETNGYHPLWQLLLVPVTRYLRGDAAIRAALLLGLVCLFAGMWLLVRLLAPVMGSFTAATAGIVAAATTIRSTVDGMEGAVVVLAVALVATALVPAIAELPRRPALLATATTLLVLARLDYLVVVPIIPLAVGLRHRSPRAAARVAAWIAAAATPLAVAWLARWHHVLTTSATVKRATVEAQIEQQHGGYLSFAYLEFLADVSAGYVEALGRLMFDHGRALTDVALLALCVVGLVVWRRRAALPATPNPRRDAARFALVTIVVLLATKAAVDLVVSPLWATAWYVTAQQVAVGLTVGVCIGEAVRAMLRWRVTVGVAVAAVAGAALVVNAPVWTTTTDARHRAGAWQDQLDLTATWLGTAAPPGRVGARDAGLLGFRLDGRREVVNLDGLVNDYEFAGLVVERTSILSLARREDVRLLVGRFEIADDCARMLWSSPGEVEYTDTLAGTTRQRINVYDVLSC